MSSGLREENRELLLRIQDGDHEALDRLVSLNMGLVRKIALHFVSSGTELDDLIQIGAIGMIKAARSFDHTFDTAFSTYAVPMIMGEIRRFLRDNGAIKISRELKSRGSKIRSARDEFIKTNGREPRVSELSAILGLSADDIVAAMDATAGVCSLSDPICGDDDGLTLEGSLSDGEYAIDELTDKLALSEALRSLPPLWREIVTLRYYKELSQSETGKRLGLTQVKISREEQKILSALRSALLA